MLLWCVLAACSAAVDDRGAPRDPRLTSPFYNRASSIPSPTRPPTSARAGGGAPAPLIQRLDSASAGGLGAGRAAPAPLLQHSESASVGSFGAGRAGDVDSAPLLQRLESADAGGLGAGRAGGADSVDKKQDNNVLPASSMSRIGFVAFIYADRSSFRCVCDFIAHFVIALCLFDLCVTVSRGCCW